MTVAAGSIRVQVLGPTMVTSDGVEVELTRQDRQVIATLAYLDGLSDRDEVEALSWVGHPSDRALQSTIYRIRKAVGADALITRRGRLGLNRDVVSVDADEFLTTISTAPEGGPGRQQALADALELVHGEPWADMRRLIGWDEIRRRWNEHVEFVRDELLDDRLDERVADDASVTDVIGQTRAQLDVTPLAANRWLRLIRALVEHGQPIEALRTVEAARRRFASHGEELPAVLLEIERTLLRDSSSGRPAKVASEPRHLHPQRVALTVLVGDVEMDPVWALADVVVDFEGTVVRFKAVNRTASALDVLRSIERQLAAHVGPSADVYAAIDQLVAVVDGVGGPVLIAIDAAANLDAEAVNALMTVCQRSQSASAVIALPGTNVLVSAITDEPNVIVRPIPPMTVEQVSRQLAKALLPDDHASASALHERTGGAAGLVRLAIAALARGDRPGTAVELLVDVRCAKLSPAARAVMCGAALLARGITRAEALLLNGATGPAAVLEATRSGLLEVDGDRLFIVEARRAAVRSRTLAFADGFPTLLAARVLPVESLRSAALAVEAAELLAGVDPEHNADRAVEYFLHAGRLYGQGRPQETVALVDSALEQIEAEASPASVLALLLLRATALMRSGLGASADRDFGRAYQLALESGNAQWAGRAVVAMATASIVSTGRLNRRALPLVPVWIDNAGVAERERLLLHSAVAAEGLAGGESRRSIAAAEASWRLAATHGNDLEMAALTMLITTANAGRSLLDAADRLGNLSRQHGDLAALFEGLVYGLCARMRRQTAGWADPVLAELDVIVADRPKSPLALRHGVLRLARAAMLGDPVELDRLTHMVSASSLLDTSADFGLREAVRISTALGGAPEWQRMAATELCPNVAHAPDISEIDRLIAAAAHAAHGGDAASAASLLGAIAAPVTTLTDSPWWAVRLPIVALTVAQLSDAALAERMLAMHVDLVGLDLSHLPGLYLGPASAWLALLADVAGDPRAESLHASANQRFAELGASRRTARTR